MKELILFQLFFFLLLFYNIFYATLYTGGDSMKIMGIDASSKMSGIAVFDG